MPELFRNFVRIVPMRHVFGLAVPTSSATQLRIFDTAFGTRTVTQTSRSDPVHLSKQIVYLNIVINSAIVTSNLAIIFMNGSRD